MGQTLQRLMVVWALFALAVWALLFAAEKSVTVPQIGYYVVVPGFGGLLLWQRRDQVRTALQKWRPAPLPRYLILAYGMVLAEEIVAASFNHLLEGFDLATLPLRIGQFWALNVLAFTGWIWGWYLLRAWFAYTPREVFFLSGGFGLFAEHTIAFLSGNVTLFLLIAPLNVFTYGLILSPAMMSLPPEYRNKRRMSAVIRYPLAFFIPLLASLIPILFLTVLRSHFPGWFPPCRFVSC